MASRIARVTVATLIVLVGGATIASAATIDPDLKAYLESKRQPDVVPVLVVFPAHTGLEDLEQDLQGDTPTKRRDRVIAALKKKARKAQANVWNILEDPDTPGHLAYADMLYLSNALAFAGDRDMIVSVADAPGTEDVVIYRDKHYEFTEAAQAAPPPASGGEKAAEADTAWNVLYVQADRVWHELGYTGEGILVGHIDSGLWLTHPDLANHIWTNPGEIPGNGVDDDGNGFVDDVHGWDFGEDDNDPNDDALSYAHGTHTAGTVVGDGTFGTVTGIAPGATLMPVKVVGNNGSAPLSSLWAAEQYCLENGARIITMSWGLVGDIPTIYLRNDRFNALALRAAGITFFNSAGNYHNSFDPPIELGMTARIPAPWNALPVPYSSTGGVITIGGSGYQNDDPLDISSQGPADWSQVDPWLDWPYDPEPGLIKPDLTAPGRNIQSTLPPPFYYSPETWTGTSMACPHAAGTAALMLQKNPTLSPAGIDSILEQTARDAGAPGKDNVMGAGVIDAFAAVSAVSLDLLPNLEMAAYHPDPGGNGTLDPGELADVTFAIGNPGFAGATGVVGHLEIEGNPHVAVLQGDAGFPDIPAGLTGENVAVPFRLAVSPVAPQGLPFTMYLTVGTAEGFERTFDVQGYVGLPEHRTHDVGAVYLTVTDNGGVGYLDDGRARGLGMGLRGQPSMLFISSLWAGTDALHLCNNDLRADGADPAEWQTRLAPSGRVQDLMGEFGDQAFRSAFTDSGLAEPLGIEVTQTSWAYEGVGSDHLVIVQFEFRNTSAQTVEGYHAGLFMDWDVLDSMDNSGHTDATRQAAWICHETGTCFGATVVGDAPVSNLSLIENPVYLYPESHVPDLTKIQFLTGDLRVPASETMTDWSCIVAVGPLDIPAGESRVAAFALVHGADEAEFLAGCAQAAALYSPISSVPDREWTPVPAYALAQNSPNPFNPSTRISFTLPQDGPVQLAVYDLSGRLVRTLLSGALPAGDHAAVWDGRDDAGTQAASGVYVYRLQTAEGLLTRKMMLVK